MIIMPKQVKNLSYVVIDDLYSTEEVEQIKNELRELIPFGQSGEKVGAASDNQSSIKKNAMGLFLDYHYPDRNASAILGLNRRIFNSEIVEEAVRLNQYFGGIEACTNDYTLINYYGNGEEYKAHKDNSMLTAVTFFKLGDATGGDFEFPEVEEVVPFKENRAVIFPGCVLHAAKGTIAKMGSYRVSMAQFLNYR